MSKQATLLLAGLLIGLGLLVVAVRIGTPSDGAFLDNSKPSVGPGGLAVTTIGAETVDGLRDGDVVVAVAGTPVEEHARRLLSPAGIPGWWRVGETVTYTVERDGQRLDVPVRLTSYSLASAARRAWGQVLFGVLLLAVGAFVFARRPDDPAARLLFLFLTANCVASSVSNALDLQISDFVGGIGFWAHWAAVMPTALVIVGAWLCFALRFPQPHPLLVRHPRAVRLAATGAPAASIAVGLVATGLSTESALGWAAAVNTLMLTMYLVSIVVVISATIANFRVAAADPVARRQAKWVMLALLTFAFAAGFFWVLPVLLGRDPWVSEQVLSPIGVVVPLGLAIAILRHNVFDVDLIFNRALVYGSLVGTLASLYWASVVVLQRLFGLVGGELSDLAVVVSTLGIAALLNPLRQRLQAVVDRRFDRQKYDAAKTLAAFSASVRDEVDLDQLTRRLAAVVEDTMQANQVTVWLRWRS